MTWFPNTESPDSINLDAYNQEDLFDQQDDRARQPIVVLIDESGSMVINGRIVRINTELKRLCAELKTDPVLKDIGEILIITFGDRVKVIQPWTPVLSWEFKPIRATARHTRIGNGMRVAARMIIARRKFYKNNRLKAPYKAFLLGITDGGSFGESQENLDTGRTELKQLDLDGKMMGFFAAVDQSDVDVIADIWDLPKRGVKELSKLSIAEIVSWLIKSLKQVSQGAVGAVVAIPNPTRLIGTQQDTKNPSFTSELAQTCRKAIEIAANALDEAQQAFATAKDTPQASAVTALCESVQQEHKNVIDAAALAADSATPAEAQLQTKNATEAATRADTAAKQATTAAAAADDWDA